MPHTNDKKDGTAEVKPTLSIVRAIPLSRGAPPEALSYFTSSPVAPGFLLEVPLRGKKTPAIVVSVENASEQKTDLRALPYELQKITRVHGKSFLTPAFIESVAEIARYFAGSLGNTLAALIPHALLQNPRGLAPPSTPARRQETPLHLPFALQADTEDRIIYYRGLIREEFARGASVFLTLPTVPDIEKIAPAVTKGIEEFSFVLHGALPKKEMRSRWIGALSEKHPVLVIGTGPFLSLPRHDLGAIVIERENSRAYKTLSRPFVDIRLFAETLARKLRIKLILADMVLRAETMWRLGEGEFFPALPIQPRLLSTAALSVVDMRRYKTSPTRGFSFISDELEILLRKTKTENERLFLFVSRRGFALEMVCADCGTVVMCSQCSTPITLHHEERPFAESVSKGNFFLCHKCGERRSAEERCANCRSWKIQMLGVGTERVAEEIKNRFPEIKIFQIDSDATPTKKETETVMEQFYASGGSVLIGTEKALIFLNRKVEASAVLSVESFFSLPDFRVGERLLYLLLTIRAATTKEMVLQTRAPEDRIVRAAADGNLGEFFKNELAERNRFHYPPFFTLIKLTVSGKKESVQKIIASLAIDLQKYSPTTFPAFTEKARGHFSTHILLRVPREKWVDDELLLTLRALPPYVRIAVDPDTLL